MSDRIWLPISEMHEDYSQCLLVHIADPANMRVGNNLDSWFDEADWTHFQPIKMSNKEAQEMLKEYEASRAEIASPRLNVPLGDRNG